MADRTPPAMLSYDAIARLLGCSHSHVSNLANAADYAAEIQAGKRAVDDVPPRLRRHLDSGFPRPKRIGPRLRRVPAEQFEAWAGSHGADK